MSFDVKNPRSKTNDTQPSCPLSSTRANHDECIKDQCPAFISEAEKCSYVFAAHFGLDIIRENVHRSETNIAYIHDFQTVFSEHYDLVVEIAYRMLQNNEMAEDVAQEVFVKAYKSAREVEPGMPLTAWLYRVTTNLCMDELRRQRTIRFEPFADFDVDEIHRKFKNCRPSDPEMALNVAEDRILVDNVLRKLPYHYCQSLIMRCVDNLSYEDISNAMDTTVAEIRSIIFRARRQFIRLYMELAEEANKAATSSELSL